jgi:predicted DNA-binding transcriptional regulator YafY
MNENFHLKSRVYLRALVRLSKIHKAIASEQYPGIPRLAEIAEVHERTIKRDLDVLRDEFDAPLKYDRRRKGFYFTIEGWSLPLQKITEGELLSFFIAENALRLTGHTPEAVQLKHSLAKIATFLPEEVSVNLATLGENIRFQNLPFVSVEPKILQDLAITAINQQSIEFDYYSPHNRQKTHRRADVHLLHNFAGDWYAVSFDHQAQDFRDFHVGRMTNLQKINHFFERRKDFIAEDYLNRGFFMMRGGRLITVEIHFDSYQAQWIRERNYFHPEEKREELPDGSLRLSFKIGEKGLEAVARFCLTYTGHCRVEKPAKLKEIIKEKLKKGLDLHR